MTSRSAPVASIPENTDLPKTVHKLADEWRTAAQRVEDIRKDYAEAIAGLRQAQLDDAAALSAAVLANEKLPDDRANENILRDRMADGTRRLPIAEYERDALGKRLAVALRADDVRRHIAASIKAKARPALQRYLEAIDEAERTVRQAHQDLTKTTGGLHALDALDTGKQVRLAPRPLPGVPSYAEARKQAAALAHQLDTLDERKAPSKRHVRLTDDREVHVPATLAADYLRDGIIAEWLDGWPAEKPSPALGISGTNLAAHFKEHRGQFVPRDDAA